MVQWEPINTDQSIEEANKQNNQGEQDTNSPDSVNPLH